tara:strand:+ start:977 stop:1246 length:270 start_codon:yes stop_codon:yes gene_type:complete
LQFKETHFVPVDDGQKLTASHSRTPFQRRKKAEARLRVVDAHSDHAVPDAPAEFSRLRRWSARATTLFVIACTIGLWALIIIALRLMIS